MDGYLTPLDASFSQASILGQNALMRKYDLAYRYRRFGELSFAIRDNQGRGLGLRGVGPATIPVILTLGAKCSVLASAT